MKKRCDWAENSDLMSCYHDEEWGKPLHDDQKLFEFLTLEGMQAGLSWLTVLKKREAFRIAFDQFDVNKVSQYNQDKIDELMGNSSIIRNRAKIEACINNAQRFLEVVTEFDSFDRYIWSFIDYQPIINHWNLLSQLPAKTTLSDRISADLKRRGFKFIGSTIVYAHMQATGMVNDHLTGCFCHPDYKE